MTRRDLLELTALLTGGMLASPVSGQSPALFDGKSLNGWLQYENNSILLSATAIKDPAIFSTWLTDGNDPMSVFLREHLSGQLKTDLADNPKTALPALIKELNRVLAGPSIYDKDRMSGIVLRRETAELAAQHPTGVHLARLNKLLLEDAYAEEITPAVTTGWTVKDGAMASIGSGRGVIYTANDYTRFRLACTMRHVSGNPDHQACILIFCTRPGADEIPLDALAGIQFQPPKGGHWDYRPGKNDAGTAFFATISKPAFDPHEWSRVEITADAATGTATMSVAQPPESKPVEVLAFKDPTAGKPGPIAWQMHNQGLYDEYKDVTLDTRL